MWATTASERMGWRRTSSATTEVRAGSASWKRRQPRPSKKAMPQPSACTSVPPPRAEKPEKEKQASVGTLQLIPRSWHMEGLEGGAPPGAVAAGPS